jgi:hypothetical protein
MSLADYLKHVDTPGRPAAASRPPHADNGHDATNQYRDGLAKALGNTTRSNDRPQPQPDARAQQAEQDAHGQSAKPAGSTAETPSRRRSEPPLQAQPQATNRHPRASDPKDDPPAGQLAETGNPVASVAIRFLGRENETVPAALELPLPPAAIQQLLAVASNGEEAPPESDRPSQQDPSQEIVLLPPESLSELLRQIGNVVDLDGQLPAGPLPDGQIAALVLRTQDASQTGPGGEAADNNTAAPQNGPPTRENLQVAVPVEGIPPLQPALDGNPTTSDAGDGGGQEIPAVLEPPAPTHDESADTSQPAPPAADSVAPPAVSDAAPPRPQDAQDGNAQQSAKPGGAPDATDQSQPAPGAATAVLPIVEQESEPHPLTDLPTASASAGTGDDEKQASPADAVPRPEAARPEALTNGSTWTARGTDAITAHDAEPRVDPQQLIDRVAGAIRRAQGGAGQLRVRLHPPELGVLQIEVSARNGLLAARLEVHSATAHQVLTEHLGQLREALAQNVGGIDRIEVHLAENEHEEGRSELNYDQQSGSGFEQEHDSDGDDSDLSPSVQGNEFSPAARESSETSAGYASMDRLDIEI